MKIVRHLTLVLLLSVIAAAAPNCQFVLNPITGKLDCVSTNATSINGGTFAGANGNLVSFGAANTPADSGIASATVVKGAAGLSNANAVNCTTSAGTTSECTNAATISAIQITSGGNGGVFDPTKGEYTGTNKLALRNVANTQFGSLILVGLDFQPGATTNRTGYIADNGSGFILAIGSSSGDATDTYMTRSAAGRWAFGTSSAQGDAGADLRFTSYT